VVSGDSVIFIRLKMWRKCRSSDHPVKSGYVDVFVVKTITITIWLVINWLFSDVANGDVVNGSFVQHVVDDFLSVGFVHCECPRLGNTVYIDVTKFNIEVSTDYNKFLGVMMTQASQKLNIAQINGVLIKGLLLRVVAHYLKVVSNGWWRRTLEVFSIANCGYCATESAHYTAIDAQSSNQCDVVLVEVDSTLGITKIPVVGKVQRIRLHETFLS